MSEHTFRDDTRGGAATQIDFVNGMIILLAGVLFYFAVTSLFLSSLETPSPGDQATAIKSSDKLVEDAFLENPGDDTVSTTCIDAYFTQTPNEATCEQNQYWAEGGTDDQYLERSLSLKSTQNAKIVLHGSTGEVYSLGGNIGSGNVGKYERQIVADLNGDGTKSWYTLVIYVW